MIKNQPLLALIVLLSVLIFQTQAREIRYNNSPAAKEQYLVGMLKLALEKSGGEFNPVPSSELLTDSKVMADVQAGSMDVYWSSASQSKSDKMRGVYIPLVKGLLGYRLFIIKNGQQHRFDNIDSLQQLKQLSAGQGRFWGDTQILKNAGIPLETSVKYPNLFYMLEGERFDYFPRAAHEPWTEVKEHATLDLTVEKNLMLVYPLAMIFYVNQSDIELANALERGLEQAINDGSFDDYFFGNELIQSVLNEAKLNSRKIFRINNPFLPEQMPLDRKELWLDVSAL